MDEQRARILEDLQGLLDGDLLFEPIARAPYAVDASIYEIDPLGVIVPNGWDDVRATLRYAAEAGIPVHPRGAGTGLAGESLGRGLILDLSKHFRQVLEIRPLSVVVQPGVVLAELNRSLEPLGRRIGPDPSGAESCTIGAMIASDTAGARSLLYGTTADHVLRLRVLLPGGVELELDRNPIPWPDPNSESSDDLTHLLKKLAGLWSRYKDQVLKKIPRSPRHRAGYAFHVAASERGIDLCRLFIGSEGTLGIITEVELATVAIPAAQALVLLPYSSLTAAAAAVPAILAFSPSACELHDWRSLSLAREYLAAIRPWISEYAEALMVVEFSGANPAIVNADVQLLFDTLSTVDLVDRPRTTTQREEVEMLLMMRKRMIPLLLRRPGRAHAVPLIEDIAIPPEVLAQVLPPVQNILKKYAVNWTLYAHAGAGQLHFRPFLDLSDPQDREKIEPMATEIYDCIFEFGGSISGEHGCGLARGQYLARQFGEVMQVFREIKAAFDPLDLLNPGKITRVGAHQVCQDLKVLTHPFPNDALVSARGLSRNSPDADSDSSIGADTDKETPTVSGSGNVSGFPSRILPSDPNEKNHERIISQQLIWRQRSMEEEILACNGCGACRTRQPELRMCPTFRALHVEAATPRAQVNLLRQIAAGQVSPQSWGSEEMRKNADLCIHCTLCRSECPAGVDVSALMLEAKAAYVQNHGLPLGGWMLSRLEFLTRIAGNFPRISNRFLQSPTARWFVERMFGLSRFRTLPNLNAVPFVKYAQKLGLTQPRPHLPGPRVAYFLDVYANYFDQELAEAVVAVLSHCGVNVFVPLQQRGSGMAALVAGDIDHATEIAGANLRILSNAVRDGYTVVCSEPTAAMMLQREYLRLRNDQDALAVAKNTMDVAQYLLELDQRGQLPAPVFPIPLRVGYHQPCHHRSLEIGTPGLDLIRRIPDIKVEFIDRGCSGMAGTFGLSQNHFRTSLRAGRGLLSRLRDSDIECGATECGACRIQMEHGIEKRTFHPLKLLSIAYGLNPGSRANLKAPKPKNIIS